MIVKMLLLTNNTWPVRRAEAEHTHVARVELTGAEPRGKLDAAEELAMLTS